MLPDDVVVLDELPHTATGKVMKTRLREMFRDHAARALICPASVPILRGEDMLEEQGASPLSRGQALRDSCFAASSG